MRDNPYDSVVEKVLGRIENVSDKISKNFKGVKPFNKEPIKQKDLMNAYLSITPEEMDTLIQTHGMDVVNDFIAEMESKRGVM